MSDLISRQAAITLPVMPKEHREYQTFNLDDAYEQGWDDLQKCIETLPSADRPTGEWVDLSDGGRVKYPWWESHQCDQCRYYGSRAWDYCPNCGARMKGGDSE